MAADLFAPGSFNDATRYALYSIPKIVQRFWPFYVVIIICDVASQHWSNSLLTLFTGVLSSGIIVITTAVQFRGPLHLSRWLIKGFILTSVLLSVAFWALRLLVPRGFLPHGVMALMFFLEAALYFWILPKLSGATYFFLLGNGREIALDAYVAAWGFISGKVWWRVFFISFIGAIPTVIAFFLTLRIMLPHSNLDFVRYVVDAVVGALYSIFIASATFRIVATAPHLRARYREAYQNSAQ